MHLACTVDLKMGIYFDLIGTDNVADDKQLLAVLDLCSLLHIRNWGSSKCQQYYLQSFRAINKCRVAGNNLTNVNYILLTLMCNLNQMLVIPQRQIVPKERERKEKRKVGMQKQQQNKKSLVVFYFSSKDIFHFRFQVINPIDRKEITYIACPKHTAQPSLLLTSSAIEFVLESKYLYKLFYDMPCLTSWKF